MAEMKKLPPSPFGKTCETCMFWIASEREKYYPTEQGGVMPVAKVSIAGLPHGARMLNQGQIELAPCAVAPLWGHTRPDHWCWQHPSGQRVVRSVDNDTTFKTAVRDALRNASGIADYIEGDATDGR